MTRFNCHWCCKEINLKAQGDKIRCVCCTATYELIKESNNENLIKVHSPKTPWIVESIEHNLDGSVAYTERTIRVIKDHVDEVTLGYIEHLEALNRAWADGRDSD